MGAEARVAQPVISLLPNNMMIEYLVLIAEEISLNSFLKDTSLIVSSQRRKMQCAWEQINLGENEFSDISHNVFLHDYS